MMDKYTQGNGSMTLYKEKVRFSSPMDLCMKVSGGMITSMGMGERLGKMDPSTKGNIMRVNDVDRGVSNGQTEANTQVLSTTTSLMEAASTHGDQD